MSRPEFIPEDEWVYIMDYLVMRFYNDYSMYLQNFNKTKTNDPLLEKDFYFNFNWNFGLTLKVSKLKEIIYSEFLSRDFFIEVPRKFSGLTYQITDRAKFYVEERKKDKESCLYETPENTHKIVNEGFFNIINNYEDKKIPAKFELVETFLDHVCPNEKSTPKHVKNETDNQGLHVEGIIPASNRIVTLNHNSQEYLQAEEALNNVINAIEKSNEQGPEEKEPVLTPLQNGMEYIKKSRILVGAASGMLLAPLYNVYASYAEEGLHALVEVAIQAVKVLLGLS